MKRLTTINWILKWMILATGVLMLIGWMVAPEYWHKPWSYLATMGLPFAPEFLKLFKVRASDGLVFAYEVFLVVAMILGIDLDWYATVIVLEDGSSYFDKIVHLASGALSAALGRELILGQKLPRKLRVVFMMGVVALIAVGWECFEFLYDLICGGHMQELVSVGVADTMWDIIWALGGGGVATIMLTI